MNSLNEQTRLGIAIALCVTIFVGWELFLNPAEDMPTGAKAKIQAEASQSEVAADQREEQAQAAGEPVLGQADKTALAQAANTPAVVLPNALQTSLFEADLLSRGPALRGWRLLDYAEPQNETKNPSNMQADPAARLDLAATHEGSAQAEVLWGSGHGAFVSPANGEPKDGTLWREASDVDSIQRQATLRSIPDAYGVAYGLRAWAEKGAQGGRISPKIRLRLPAAEPIEGGLFSGPQTESRALCGAGLKNTFEADESDLKEDGVQKKPRAVGWVALERQYFVVAAVLGQAAILEQASNNKAQERDASAISSDDVACEMGSDAAGIYVDLILPEQKIAAGQSWEQTVSLYLGPRKDASMAKISPDLKAVANYTMMGIPLGFLARPMLFLLDWLHGWTASWGLSIMLLTLVIKGLLFPVTYKSIVSMRKMQLLKPKLDRIKSEHAHDRERQQMEQMKLFRDEGVSPLGGCLPMLLQMPVWFALYRMLWSAVDLYQQPFLWIADLTAKEPFPILALVLGVLTFVQQKMTPNQMDAQQARVMLYMMPIMLTVFMIALPSGLVLYILVNSVLTIAQQLWVQRQTQSLSAAKA